MIRGPQTDFSEYLHRTKYRGPGESFEESASRVAAKLADPEDYHRFREMLVDLRFLPAGRVQASIGSGRSTTAFNCFVSGVLEDSFVDGGGSIMRRAAQAARTMKMGGGIGYDFSTLRPRGDSIRSLGSASSGPVSFMPIFDAIGLATASAGHRRGAQMGVLRVDHPDVLEFVRAKQEPGRLEGFNVSVAATDAFMEALESGGNYDLQFNGKVYDSVPAAEVWEAIMRSTWDWAEPGVLFIDRINRLNPLSYCERIHATNPCGEQPLPPHGACLLGSFNLVRYLTQGDRGASRLDFATLAGDVAVAVRCMDRVVDVSSYPLAAQRSEALAKRRMGLGVTGLANALEAMGLPYGSEGFLGEQHAVFRVLRDEAYLESSRLADERGIFPAFSERYLETEYFDGLPDGVQEAVRENGLRNSHLVSVAPTGTISMAADCVSAGIEPVFAYSTKRAVRTPEGPREFEVRDYGKAFLGVSGRQCHEVTVREHLDVLAVASQYADAAVSKTVNVPAGSDWEAFQEVYRRAWRLGCKGCTTFRVGGSRTALVEAVPEQCSVDQFGNRDCS